MKRASIIFAAGLLLAIVAYCSFYFAGTAVDRSLAECQVPELAWLKKEFHLSDAEFQRVSDLHAAYRPHCAEMCRRIASKDAELQVLLATNTTVTPEIKTKLTEAAQIRADCQAAMLAQFFEVSRSMPPAEGKRYLEWVEEKTFGAMQSMPSMSEASPNDSGQH
jgi:hypothetical protein